MFDRKEVLNMGDLFQLMIIAFLTETITEIIKDSIPCQFSKKINKYMSVAVALLFTFGSKLDLFSLFEMQFHIPYIGYIFSGLIVSRGSNYVHNFLGHANDLRLHSKENPNNSQ